MSEIESIQIMAVMLQMKVESTGILMLDTIFLLHLDLDGSNKW